MNEIVTRLLATTGVLIKYSRGEEIRSINRAQTCVVATRRWRRTGLLKIFIFIKVLGRSCGSVVVLLLDLAWLLGRRRWRGGCGSFSSSVGAGGFQRVAGCLVCDAFRSTVQRRLTFFKENGNDMEDSVKLAIVESLQKQCDKVNSYIKIMFFGIDEEDGEDATDGAAAAAPVVTGALV